MMNIKFCEVEQEVAQRKERLGMLVKRKRKNKRTVKKLRREIDCLDVGDYLGENSCRSGHGEREMEG